ncbi:MAG TPA: hypothetical protein VMX56_08860 [Anaerolineales bacterium]|nr:hypothetical protein [Anaerolineales bacterium]
MPVILFVLMMLVCFAAGAISVLLQGEETQDALPLSTPFESIEIGPTAPVRSGAVSILVLGVDEIEQEKPKLLSVWFISFHPPDKQIHLLGIPTDLLLPDTEIPLSEAFSLWEAPDYGADFIAAMDTFSPNPIFGIAVLDEQGYSALIDHLGGFSLDDQNYDGASAIGSLRLVEDQPTVAIKLQGQILRALSVKVADLGETPELTPLTLLLPENAYTSPSPAQLATLASPLLPLRADLIEISILGTTP